MKLSKVFALLVGVLLVGVLAACGGNAPATSAPSGGGNQAASTGDPAAAARSYIQAIYSGGDISGVICTTDAAAADAAKQAAQASAAAFASANATINSDGLTFTAANQSGNNADVTVGGNLSVTVGGQTQQVPMTAITLKMVNEGGNWKVCGASA